MFLDLNKALIPNKEGPDKPLDDLSLTSGACTVYFRMLEENFIRHAKEADAVVGCMAWLTNLRILRTLEELKGGVSIIVQKEDFLRPDQEAADWKHTLRNAYEFLPATAGRNMMPGIISGMSFCFGTELQAIRCVGNMNRDKIKSSPRMHNKFIVFCRVQHNEGCMGGQTWPSYHPYAVWTGSFNFSDNATRSFENAVVIEDTSIAEAYCDEWSQIAALSEPLDWNSEWIAPEWRIGT